MPFREIFYFLIDVISRHISVLSFQDVRNAENEEQMREISAQIAKSSEESGEKLSGGDVENTAEIINTIISSTEEELSEETMENLITTIHNVHEYTVQEEVRREGGL